MNIRKRPLVSLNHTLPRPSPLQLRWVLLRYRLLLQTLHPRLAQPLQRLKKRPRLTQPLISPILPPTRLFASTIVQTLGTTWIYRRREKDYCESLAMAPSNAKSLISAMLASRIAISRMTFKRDTTEHPRSLLAIRRTIRPLTCGAWLVLSLNF